MEHIRMTSKKFHFIYLTINKKNGKRYIGQHSTNDINDPYIGSGDLIKKALKRYGRHNFERIELYFSFDGSDLDEVESNMIECYQSHVSFGGYNIMKKSQGKVLSHDETTRRKISESLSGEKNGFFGKTHSDEVREKLRQSWKDNPDRLKTMSCKDQQGEKNPFFGKSHTEELKNARRGNGNPSANKYILTSPNKEIIEISLLENFITKCKELELSYNTLKKFYNKGPVHLKRITGNTTSEQINTIGWAITFHRIN